MSLEPDGLCLPVDFPRHKLRASGRAVRTSGGAEYRRLLNFLSKSASQGERALLGNTPVPKFAQVPSTVTRRLRSNEQTSGHRQSGSASSGRGSHLAGSHSQALSESLSKSFDSNQTDFAPPAQRNFDPASKQQWDWLQSGGASQAMEELPFSITIDEAVHHSVPAVQHVHTYQHFDYGSQPIDDIQELAEACQTAPDEELAELMARASRQRQAVIEQLLQNSPQDLATHRDSAVIYEVDSVVLSEFAQNAARVSEEVEPDSKPPAMNERAEELLAKNPAIEKEDDEFVSHLAVLLNEWFDRENVELAEDVDELPHADFHAKRREELLRNYRSKKNIEQTAQFTSKGNLAVSSNRVSMPGSSDRDVRQIAAQKEAQQRKKNKDTRRSETHKIIPMPGGMRREVYRDGSYIVKDAVGRVSEARAVDGATMSYSYDAKGHFKSFVRSDSKGKIFTTGVKDRHGVVVRDEHGAVRAQGDSMTVDSNGCVSIRKFDGQFWSLDVLRGIHIERRILEDANGTWNSLTALLTSDGFRMVTRFQKLQENQRSSYRRFGDWLASAESSKFRFYGRDGSMIQFDNDEDLQALRPSRIWPAGSRYVEREWMGRRQAGTAWEAVHRYIAQYLSAL